MLWPNILNGMGGCYVAISYLAFAQMLGCDAETFVFSGQPVPKGLSLEGWYLFNTYLLKDMMDMQPAQGQSNYHRSEVTLKVGARANSLPPKDYPSLQVAIIPHTDFQFKFDAKHFCGLTGKVEKQDGTRIVMADVILSPHDADPEDKVVTTTLPTGGKFLLFVANCANFTDASLYGQVKVQNPYGYLPPEQFHKMGPLTLFMMIYIVAGLVWTTHACAARKQFYDCHAVLSGLLFVYVVEGISQVVALWQWNNYGISDPWMTWAVMCLVMKWIYTYMVAVYISMGWHDTDFEGNAAEVSWTQVIALFVVMALYSSLTTIKEFVLQQRDALDLQSNIIIGATAPVLIMDAIMAFFVVKNIREQQAMAEQNTDLIRSSVYSKLHMAAVLCIVISTAGAMAQLADVFELRSLGWSSRWIPREGVAHTVALITICSTLVILRPGMISRANTYGKVVPDDARTLEENAPLAETVGRPDDLDDED